MRSRARRHHPRRPVAPIEPPRFTVGRDHHGWWVVEDRLGRVGGIFVTEDAAVHYALEESNRDRNAVQRQKPSNHVEFRLGT